MTLLPAHSVKVVEVIKVAPAPPLPPPSSLPLTHYDAIWLNELPTQRLFFYQTSSNDSQNTATQILSELKQSLSITLRHFYPLAGKLVWPPECDAPSIRYVHGDAVSVTVAESSGNVFHRLAGAGFIHSVDYHPLLPKLPGTPCEMPTIAFQVTFFGEDGFSVGYTAPHAAIDGKSTAMFMHSWATICREKGGIETPLNPEHTPCFDRSMISDPTNLLQNRLDKLLDKDGCRIKGLALKESHTPSNLVRGTFLLTRVDIDYLKSSVQAKWIENYGKDIAAHVTSFTVTLAYIWTCLVKSQFTLIEEENSRDQFYARFSVDMRSLVGDPRASNYFGNCIRGGLVKLSWEQIWREDAIAVAAKLIKDAVKRVKDGVPFDFSEIGRVNFIKPGFVTGVAGSPWLKLYDVDFGWGRPKKVEVISIDQSRSLSLSESRDSEGGIEIGIVLEEPKMEVFAALFAGGLEERR